MDLSDLYFACGEDLDVTALRARTGGGQVVSIARLSGYRLAFFGHSPIWDSGVEALVADDSAESWGVLYRLLPLEWERLDAALGAGIEGAGAHFHYPVEVATPAGQRCLARTYRKASRGQAQPPSREYLAFLVEQASARGLPPSYLELLAAIPSAPARYPVPKREGPVRRRLHVL
jgi:hypothetical protein